MKDTRIRVRIIPTLGDLPTSPNPKEDFWFHISKSIHTETNNPEYLESKFRKDFPTQLKIDLKKKYINELREIESSYRVDFEPRYFDKMFFHYFEKEGKFRIDDYMMGISRLQEIKNEYFKENKEYQDLLMKYLLSTQIEFGVQNIHYSSLGFDFQIEPIEKVIRLFDNNFELFSIFLNSYIPQSFQSSITDDTDSLPISISIDYPETLKTVFNEKPKTIISSKRSENAELVKPDKWDKAKWIWSLANGSLLVPVLLSLLVLYIAFNKIEKVNEIREQNFKTIQAENNMIILNYMDLIKIQNVTFKDIIAINKTDTIK
jgi:hypothetical protein